MSAPQDSAALRRHLTRRLFFGLPLLGAAIAARPQVAQAGSSSSTWKMEGNSDVDDNDFIGSKNDKSLVFKTKNIERMRITNGGRVGINVASPSSASLQVAALGTTAVRGDSPSTDTAGTGVWGQLTAAAPGASGAAVRGQVTTTTSRNGFGVFGVHTGRGVGVYGVGTDRAEYTSYIPYTAQEGVGVVGAGDAIGVLGAARPWDDGGGIGVVGRGGRNGIGVAGSAAGLGPIGVSASASGESGRAVKATVSSEYYVVAVEAIVEGPALTNVDGLPNVSPGEIPAGVLAVGQHAVVAQGIDVGVYGSAQGEGFAGYFRGVVQVEQEIRVGGGVTDFSVHYVPTSPDRLAVYSGNAVLDAAGAAAVTVTIEPGRVFSEVRYQLTAIGGAAPNLHISQELTAGVFAIAGGVPGNKVSWRIEGVQ